MRNKKGNVGATALETALVVAIVGLIVFTIIRVVNKEKNAMAEREEIQRKLSTGYDPTLATTVGNNSYIRLDISGSPGENATTVLKMVAGFEEKNPDKEVVGWAVDGQQRSYSIKPKIYGLWINHRPKPPPSLEK